MRQQADGICKAEKDLVKVWKYGSVEVWEYGN
jgi:hypothetical protein